MNILLFLNVILVSPTEVSKSLVNISKLLKQLETDLKIAQNDKKPLPGDNFVNVMNISFSLYSSILNLQMNRIY